MGRKRYYTYEKDNFTGTAKDFEERYGIPANIFTQRVNTLGWPIYRAVKEPVRDISRKTSEFNYKVHDYYGSLPNIATHFKIDYPTLLSESSKVYKDDKNIEKIVDKLISLKENKELEILTENKNINYYRNELDKSKENKNKILDEISNNDVNSKNIIKENLSSVLKSNIIENRIYNPILDWCLENHKDYNVIMSRIANKNMTFEEARTIPMENVKIKNLVYKENIASMKTFCNRYKLDFSEVYSMSQRLYDFEYIIDILRKRKEN